MIESLAEHGVQAADLAPALMTTHKVANPKYDPVEGKKQEMQQKLDEEEKLRKEEMEAEDIADDLLKPKLLEVPKTPISPSASFQTTANVL